jgi:aminotransferase
MMKVHQYAIMCASIIAQEAAIEALTNGESATAEMREQYRMRRNFIVKALNDMGLPCHLPRGSFYAFPNITSTGLGSKEFAIRLLNEEKVACVPGGAFGPSGEGFLRCCFATAFDQIQIAMDRTAKFVERTRKG